ELGPGRNSEFSGGAPVQRRFKELGFDVIVDVRCGDFLKLLPRLRTASENGSPRIYKPLLLLDAIARAVRNEQRLLAFSVYEESIGPLLERFTDAHGDSALANAWWRLPGDEVWEVVSTSGSVIRPAGKRASSGPPSTPELRDQLGGFPKMFHDALREV